MIIDLATISTVDIQYYLQHVVAPRPVCFASTIGAEGNVNLSPFSFFNMFSANPPIVIFSPSRRVRDNTVKHTLENVRQVPEVVINIVTANMVQQVSLASCDYPKGTNEFEKAGFTAEKASVVRPPMVKESLMKLECRVNEIKPLGTDAGAGNLVICEVLRLHLSEEILGENRANGLPSLDQRNIHHVARLGSDWYSVVNENNLFKVEKPNTRLGIGFDLLPQSIRQSSILTGNQLAQLANVCELPVVDSTFHDDHLTQIILYYSLNPEEMESELHRYAQTLLHKGNVNEAWQVLLAGGMA